MGRCVWSSEQDFTLDEVRYRSMAGRTAPDQMVLLKPRPVIEAYEALIDTTNPRRILELGIYAGGSTTLLAQLARPDKLVAIDHATQPCALLEQFIDSHGLRGVVAPCYGVDQANSAQLDDLMARELGGSPVDLIIDDASHLEPETRASFNRLFPHLRPGGAFIIEDWAWPHQRLVHRDRRYQGVTPLSALVCEIVLAAACRPAVIAGVTVDRSWTLVRRGTAALNPARFDISANFDPVGREMVDRLSLARTLKPG